MRTTLSVRAGALVAVATLGLTGAAWAGAEKPRSAIELLLAGELIEIFSDGFEIEECAPWSATSNPLGAVDFDEDDFGDDEAPTAYCQLPDGFAADATDCDDADAAIHPGAVELCNEVDDNCVDGIDEGFDFQADEQNCGSCGNVCQQVNGSNTCVTGNCQPSCSFGFFNCDGNPENGCEAARNINPACPGSALDTVAGDEGSDIDTVSGFAEAWYNVQILEASDFPVPLKARVSLSVPAGVDFDLFAYCFSCGESIAASSTGGTGVDEELLLLVNDDFGEEDTHNVVIEIRFVSGAGGFCANWTLTVEGNAGAPALETCNP